MNSSEICIDLHQQVVKLNGMEDQEAYGKLMELWKNWGHLLMRYHFPVKAQGFYPTETNGINTFVILFPINGWRLER